MRSPRTRVADIPKEILAIVGAIHSREPLATSRRDVTHLVGENGDFVLKRSDLSNLPTLHHESQTLELLTQSEFPLSEHCLLPAKAFGNAVFQLSTYIPGSSLRNALGSGNDYDDRIVAASAALLRKIHSLPVPPEPCHELLSTLLSKAEANMQKGLLDPEEFTDLPPIEMLDWLMHCQPSDFEVVFSHGDFRPKNIIWNEQAISGIVDWEHSLYCGRYYDISIFHYYLPPEQRQTFVRAYGMGSLDEEEMRYFERLSKFLNV